MKQSNLKKIADIPPYEIVEVELLSPIKDGTKEDIENYLTLELEAVDVIEIRSPFYTIKRVKDNIGIGN